MAFSPTALSNLENGNSKPDIERLEDIAIALGIDLNQLLLNPQQLISFHNNSPQSNGIIYGSNTQQNIDREIVERILSVMEKLSDYFTKKTK